MTDQLQALERLFNDQARVEDAVLQKIAFELVAELKERENLHDLTVAADLLAYHARTRLLAVLLEFAWPMVQTHPSMSPAARQSYASHATDVILFEYLEAEEEPQADDPSLLARLRRFFDADPVQLQSYLSVIRGMAGRPWELGHFRPLSAAHLSGLAAEFLAYLYQFEQVPYTRAQLARQQLPLYLLAREAGHLYVREDIGDLMRRGQFPRSAPPRPENPLLPDAETFERWQQRLAATVQPRVYAAMATVEQLPAWERFLTSRGLA